MSIFAFAFWFVFFLICLYWSTLQIPKYRLPLITDFYIPRPTHLMALQLRICLSRSLLWVLSIDSQLTTYYSELFFLLCFYFFLFFQIFLNLFGISIDRDNFTPWFPFDPTPRHPISVSLSQNSPYSIWPFPTTWPFAHHIAIHLCLPRSLLSDIIY